MEEPVNNMLVPTDTQISDYNHFIAQLNDEQKKSFLELAKDVSPNDSNTLQSYGASVSSAIESTSGELLGVVRSNNSNQIVGYVNETLAQLNLLNIDDIDPNNKFKNWLRTLPVIKTMVKSVEKYLDEYDTIENNLAKIAEKMQVASFTAKKDNATLEKMLQSNTLVINNLRQLIIGLKLRKDELEVEKENLEKSNANSWEIQKMNNFINDVTKKIANLESTEKMLTNSQYEIMATQSNNDAIIGQISNIIETVLPNWRNQLAMAVLIAKQQDFVKGINAISDAGNKIIIETAKQVRQNTEDTAKNSEQTIVSLEALKQSTNEIITMCKNVDKIHREGAIERTKFENALANLSSQVNGATRQIEHKK